MKTVLSVLTSLAVLAFAFIAPISHASEAAPVPDIEFLGQTYSLAWRSDPTPQYSKSEYLPADERLPYYHNMLLVERVSGISVTDAVRAQVGFLQERAKADASARIRNLIENPATSEVLLVFTLSAPDEERETIWEWNAYRYSPDPGDDGQQGVRLFGYSVRHYGHDDSVYAFLEELDNKQSERVNALAGAKLP